MDDTDDDPTFNPNIDEPFSASRPRHSLFPLAKPNSQQTFDSSVEEEHPPQVPRSRPVAGRSRPVAGRARQVAGRARPVASRSILSCITYQLTLPLVLANIFRQILFT